MWLYINNIYGMYALFSTKEKAELFHSEFDKRSFSTDPYIPSDPDEHDIIFLNIDPDVDTWMNILFKERGH